ncbi:MAG TPA: hypothetical protein VF765_34540 [Polyangiaceae bacterium]
MYESRCPSWLAAPLALIVAAGCGGTSTVFITKHVSVEVAPGGGSLPFDPSQARIQQAAARLETIAGHPMAFEFDVARLPDWRQGFEDALADMLEESARDLADEQRGRPEAFAYAMPLIDRVICRYEVERKGAELDLANHAVVLTGTAGATLVPRGTLSDAIEKAYADMIARRFANVDPDAVARADRAAYFEWLGSQPSNPEYGPETILKALRLAQLVGTGDAKLSHDIRRWLLDRMDDYARAYWNDTPRVLALPPDAPWHRAEAAWSAWLTATMASLPDDEAGWIVHNAFPPVRDGIRPFPGFDPFDFGLMIADRWAKAGHPTSESAYYADIVCPIEHDQDDPKGRKNCRDSEWYPYALRTDANTKRLAQALIARRDPVLTRTVFRNVGIHLPLWRELEPDEPTWHDAALEMGNDEDAGDAPFSELRRLWRAYPARRGVILYMLAASWGNTDLPSEYIVNDKVDDMAAYTKFPSNFDGGITRADFASFLDQGPRAAGMSQWLMPWLTKGWSPVDLLLPHLDAYFQLPANERSRAGQSDPFTGTVLYVCKRMGQSEFAKLWAYHLKRDAARRPGDALDTSLAGVTPKDCR